MGREAETICMHEGKTYKVKALLESTELILRGELKRKLPLTVLKNVVAKGPALSLTAEGESFALHLGATVAAS